MNVFGFLRDTLTLNLGRIFSSDSTLTAHLGLQNTADQSCQTNPVNPRKYNILMDVFVHFKCGRSLREHSQIFMAQGKTICGF